MIKINSISWAASLFILASLLAIIPSIGFGAGLTITPVDPDTPKPKVLWERTFITDKVAKGYKIVATPDGGAVVVIPQRPANGKTVGIWVIRLDANGKTVWDKLLTSSSKVVRIFMLKLFDDNSIAISCDIQGEMEGATYPWLIRLNLQGDILWQYVHVDRQCPSSISSFYVDGKGIITFAGIKRCFVGEPNKSLGIPYPWFGKMNSNGNILWDRVIKSTILRGGFQAMVPLGNNFVCSGGILTKGYKIKIIIVSYSDNGKLLWSNMFGATAALFNNHMIVNKQKKVEYILNGIIKGKKYKTTSNVEYFIFSSDGIIIDERRLILKGWDGNKDGPVLIGGSCYNFDHLFLFGTFVDLKAKLIKNILLIRGNNTSTNYIINSKPGLIAKSISTRNGTGIFILRSRDNGDAKRATIVSALLMNTD